MDEHKLALAILLAVFAVGTIGIILSYTATHTGEAWRLRGEGNPATRCPEGHSYQQYVSGNWVNICINKGNYFCCPSQIALSPSALSSQ